MILVSTPEKRRSVAPAAWRDHADKYFGVKPKPGSRNWAASFIILLISVGVILTQEPPLLKVSRF